jgi:hypothetical protein
MTASEADRTTAPGSFSLTGEAAVYFLEGQRRGFEVVVGGNPSPAFMLVGHVLETVLARHEGTDQDMARRTAIERLCGLYLADHPEPAGDPLDLSRAALPTPLKQALVGRPLLRRYWAMQTVLNEVFMRTARSPEAALETYQSVYGDWVLHGQLERMAWPANPVRLQAEWRRARIRVGLRVIPFMGYAQLDLTDLCRAEMWWLITHDRPMRQCQACRAWFVLAGKVPWLQGYCLQHRDSTSRWRVMRQGQTKP